MASQGRSHVRPTGRRLFFCVDKQSLRLVSFLFFLSFFLLLLLPFFEFLFSVFFLFLPLPPFPFLPFSAFTFFPFLCFTFFLFLFSFSFKPFFAFLLLLSFCFSIFFPLLPGCAAAERTGRKDDEPPSSLLSLLSSFPHARVNKAAPRRQRMKILFIVDLFQVSALSGLEIRCWNLL